MSYSLTFSPYRGVNTPRLGYENQAANDVQGNNLYSEIHTKRIITLEEQNV